MRKQKNKLELKDIDLNNLPLEPLDLPLPEEYHPNDEDQISREYEKDDQIGRRIQTPEEKDQDKHNLQMSLSKNLLILLIMYLLLVLYIIVGNGVDHVIHWPFPIPFLGYIPVVKNLKNDPNVLMMLLGTTSVNIIGLYLVVVKHLFPESKAKKNFY